MVTPFRTQTHAMGSRTPVAATRRLPHNTTRGPNMSAINLGMPRSRDTDWHLDAVCATTDPELFFPNDGDRHAARRARELCATCPVAQQCLEFALSNGE